MIAFPVGQSKQALFENGVSAIPQCDAKAKALLVIGETGKAVLTPAISTRAGLIMSKVIPPIPILAVIFPDGSPVPLTEVGSPLLPRGSCITDLFESNPFGIQHRGRHDASINCRRAEETVPSRRTTYSL